MSRCGAGCHNTCRSLRCVACKESRKNPEGEGSVVMSRKNKHQPPEFAHSAANPQRAARVAALRRSGAAGKHDARPHRQRTRAAARCAAVRTG